MTIDGGDSGNETDALQTCVREIMLSVEKGLKTHPGFEVGVRLLAFIQKNQDFKLK